jgi:hypothetical protein
VDFNIAGAAGAGREIAGADGAAGSVADDALFGFSRRMVSPIGVSVSSKSET